MKRNMAFLMAALYRDFLAYSTGELKKLGLSYGQLPFVLYVGKHPGCTPAELTSKMRMDWGYSQRSITKLVEGGFLAKERSEAEDRNYHLSLTQAGESAFAACHEIADSWDAGKLDLLEPEEQQQLFTLLYKLAPKKVCTEELQK